MRAPCTFLAGVVLTAPLIVSTPGCDSGTSELDKPAEIKKVDAKTDMPGFNQMQEKLKKQGKTKR